MQNILYAGNTDSTIPGWTENDLRQLSMADYIVATDGTYIHVHEDYYIHVSIWLHVYNIILYLYTHIHLLAVIYSDKLTDAFLSCLAQLHFKLNKTPTILLAFERRYIWPLHI